MLLWLCLVIGCSSGNESSSATYTYTGNFSDNTGEAVYGIITLTINPTSVTGYAQLFPDGETVIRGPVRGTVSVSTYISHVSGTFTITSETTSHRFECEFAKNDTSLGGTFSPVSASTSISKSLLPPQVPFGSNPGNFAMTVDTFDRAYEQYGDLIIRHDLQDEGQMPFLETADAISPDIIVSGSGPLPYPEVLADASSYSSDPGTNVTEGTVNYVYVRAKNFSSAASDQTDGTVSLYYSPPFLPLMPEDWISNTIETTDGSSSVSISASGGNVGVGDGVFLFFPEATPYTGYSLVSVLQTSNHPVNIPGSFSTADDYSDWILNNPGVVYRTVYIADASQSSYVFTYNLRNIASQKVHYALGIRASGIPEGAVISLVATESSTLEPPINISQTVRSATDFAVTAETRLPRNYVSDLTLTVDLSEGGAPSDGASISLELYYITTDQPSFTNLDSLPVNEGELPRKMLLIGQANVIFQN